jgi:hypothetical protein
LEPDPEPELHYFACREFGPELHQDDAALHHYFFTFFL